jgi:hypothetical protein
MIELGSEISELPIVNYWIEKRGISIKKPLEARLTNMASKEKFAGQYITTLNNSRRRTGGDLGTDVFVSTGSQKVKYRNWLDKPSNRFFEIVSIPLEVEQI